MKSALKQPVVRITLVLAATAIVGMWALTDGKKLTADWKSPIHVGGWSAPKQ